MTPRHTPYDGSSKLFQIGLKPLDLHDWIDADAHLLAYLDAKDQVMNRVPHEVFVAEAGTEAAQNEVLHLLADHLPHRFPNTYHRLGPQVDIVPAFRRLRMDAPFLPPLLIAAGLVQEDLVLMRKGVDGWRLAAGCVCFASSWSLPEKFGKALDAIHAPVPGFSGGTRNATIMSRIFDNLTPDQPVVRWNWSVYGNDELHHPHLSPPRRFDDGMYLRLERQTLRKLPVSSDILFTIRIYIDPLEALSRRHDGPELARAIAAQIEALSPEELAYKGLTMEKDRLLQRLSEIV
jgi:dimethylamine monooxygenase subunit A